MSKSTALVVPTFKENAITEFGNQFLSALVMQAAAEDAASAALAQAGEAKKFLQFEMVKATMFAHGKDEKLNPFAVWGGIPEVRKYNTRILTAFGVMKEEVEDGQIVRKWSDKKIEALYQVDENLKESNKAEYDRRSANWKRLTLQLTTAAKVACKLIESKLTADDLTYSVDPETNEQVPTLRKAPKEIQGEEKGPVTIGARKPRKGAQLSPTMASLVKVATDSFEKKKADKSASRTDDTRSDASAGMTDEAFGSVINTALRAIKAQEGRYTPAMMKFMKSLLPELESAIKRGVSKPEPDAH